MVVGGTVVITGCGGVVATGAEGVAATPDGATVEAGAVGGIYPQPDSAMALEILIVEITFAPLFTRSCVLVFNVLAEHIVVLPDLSVLPEATRDHFQVFFDFTPTSTTTGFDFHFVPALIETKFPRSTVVVMERTGAFASTTCAKTARPNPRTTIPWAIRAIRALGICIMLIVP